MKAHGGLSPLTHWTLSQIHQKPPDSQEEKKQIRQNHSILLNFLQPLMENYWCLVLSSTGVHFVTNYLGLYSDFNRNIHVGVPVGQSWRKQNHIFSASFGYSTNSPNPTKPPGVGGGNIYAFSGGLSENECKYLNERDHKFYCTFFLLGGAVKKFFLCSKGSKGHILTRECPLEHPEKVFFCDWKRPK